MGQSQVAVAFKEVLMRALSMIFAIALMASTADARSHRGRAHKRCEPVQSQCQAATQTATAVSVSSMSIQATASVQASSTPIHSQAYGCSSCGCTSCVRCRVR